MSDIHTRALYLAHRRGLVKYAQGFVRDSGCAEDIVQEAFLRFREATRLRSLDNPAGFLYRIVRNLSTDLQRRQAFESRHMQALDDDAHLDQMAVPHPGPEAELAEREAAHRVLTAMEAMPERVRIALQMHRLEGAKLKDIAARLGVSVTVAHRLVADGVQRCRDSLRVD